MKRLAAAAAVLLLLAALCGCGKERPVTANADEFVICIRLQTQEAVMCAGLDYYINGEFLGGQVMNHADGSALEPDKEIVFRFSAEWFPPETKDFNGFSFAVKLSAEPPAADIEDVANSVGFSETALCAPFTLEYGNVYRFTVSGSFADGFVF